MTILVCDNVDCEWISESNFCSKKVVKIRCGICQQLVEHQLFMDLKGEQEKNEPIREKKINEK